MIAGLKCFLMEDMESVMKENTITIAILTVPIACSQAVAEEAVRYGIRGILNFTTVSLNMPPDVYLEEYDMITSIEKVIAYFAKRYSFQVIQSSQTGRLSADPLLRGGITYFIPFA
ncbi:MAG: hypothetical protein R2727_04630 [Bacteroidales bacterium]